MGGIAVLIVWIVIIVVFTSLGKKKQGSFQKTVQGGQNITKQNAAGYGRSTAGNHQSMTKYSQMAPKNDKGAGRKKQTAYRQNDGIYRQDALNPKDDILARANSNIKQHFSENVLKQEQKEIPKDRIKQQLMFVGENTDLMKEVFDLMIVGPDTSTYYGRDFVAESVEMINRSLESV